MPGSINKAINKTGQISAFKEQTANNCRQMSDGKCSQEKAGQQGSERLGWGAARTVVVRECLTPGDTEQSPDSDGGPVII